MSVGHRQSQGQAYLQRSRCPCFFTLLDVSHKDVASGGYKGHSPSTLIEKGGVRKEELKARDTKTTVGSKGHSPSTLIQKGGTMRGGPDTRDAKTTVGV
eukprot:1146227-Pelagomonas_calceolata.AAC.3